MRSKRSDARARALRFQILRALGGSALAGAALSACGSRGDEVNSLPALGTAGTTGTAEVTGSGAGGAGGSAGQAGAGGTGGSTTGPDPLDASAPVACEDGGTVQCLPFDEV